MFVLWRIISLSELLSLLRVNPRERAKYVHSVVYLAQDFKAIEKWYPDFGYTIHVFSPELEKDLDVLRYIVPDFGFRKLDVHKIERFRRFTEDRELTPILADYVYSRKNNSVPASYRLKKDVRRRVNKLLEEYLKVKETPPSLAEVVI